MPRRIRVSLTDTMSFWDNQLESYVFNPDAKTQFEETYELPDEDFSSGQLTDEAVERLYGNIYGRSWRGGNGDGSRFQPLELRIEHLDGEMTGDAWVRTEPNRAWTRASD